MPDWAKEIRAAIAPLNLDPMQEAELVEELSQHLRDRYDEMLGSGTDAEQAYQSLLKELNDGTLVSGLRASLRGVHPPLPVGKDQSGRTASQESGTTCALARGCCEKIRDSRWWRS